MALWKTKLSNALPSEAQFMKFIIKIALVILAAKVLASTPRGTSHHLDIVGDLKLRDVATELSTSVTNISGTVSDWWSISATPKVAVHRRTNARHPEG